VVIKSVPPGVTVVGIPGRVVTKRERPAMDLEHARLPDPVSEAIRGILKDHHRMEERLRQLESAINPEGAREEPVEKREQD
jgi:serine O-acetyltransferase